MDKALSIQSHPDKALAQRLHAERPKAGTLARQIILHAASEAVHHLLGRLHAEQTLH